MVVNGGFRFVLVVALGVDISFELVYDGGG
jgi:hypothetical protein